jgi:hypothetical protein
MTRAARLAVTLAIALLAIACRVERETGEASRPLGPNAACYVCHMTFVGEPLAKQHLEAGIGCINCHGVSSAHANDENIGATPPDIVIEGDKAVIVHCHACHPTHDAEAAEMLARWKDRHASSPAPEPLDWLAVRCTACHGNHRIERQAAPTALGDPSSG